MISGRCIRVRGQVQGVGFRPFVQQLATRMGLTGDVCNDAQGVLIRVAGNDLDNFEAALRAQAPPLSRIDVIETAPLQFARPPKNFVIAASTGHGAQTGVAPDAATCPESLMAAEMASYHGAGTCTFYGTANTNQMLMEFMGLHLPGASFVNPNTPLRDALTTAAVERASAITAPGHDYRPAGEILDERAYVNGLVGLMATGGSTNLVLHLPAMARASGVLLDLQDFDDISQAVPLMAKVYPNGLADVNHFHAAGGLPFMIGQLIDAGLLHADAKTVLGDGLAQYRNDPKLQNGALVWQAGPEVSQNDKILRPAADPFQPTGGLRQLLGNLGRAVIKVSAVAPERHIIEAPARIFHSQEAVKAAFKAGEFTTDTVIVLRFQGPRANGMPELHSLTPALTILQDCGLKIALVTDGRMSGASGKVPSAIHVSPEAALGGPLAKLMDSDIIRLDAVAGTLSVTAAGFDARANTAADLSANAHGIGRELFEVFRRNVGTSETGAGVVV